MKPTNFNKEKQVDFLNLILALLATAILVGASLGLGKFIANQAYEKQELYTFDFPSATINYIESTGWRETNSYNSYKSSAFSIITYTKSNDSLTIFIDGEHNEIRRIVVTRPYSERLVHNYERTLDDIGEFLYEEEEFKVYKIGLYQGAFIRIGNRLQYEIQLSE